MVSAATLFAMKDGFAKYLGGIYPVMQLLWVQYSLLLLIVLPTIVVRHGWRSLWPSHIIPQIARGMMSMLAVGLFYIAITEIPLADATALIFISPVVVTALSPFLLHESVGFIGIIFIVQPGFQEFRLGTLASLGAGVIWAFFQIMTRSLAQQGIPLVTVLYTALIGAATMNILLPFYWVTPVLSDGVMLLLMAGFASVGQALLIYAFVAAPAVVVSPFVYVTIIVATATGYIAFGDLPGLMTWVGITVIIASGIYIALREAKVKEPD